MKPDTAADRLLAERALLRVLEFLTLDVSTLDDAQRGEWRRYLQRLQPASEFYATAPETPAGTLTLLASVRATAAAGIKSLLREDGWPLPSALLVGVRKQTRPLRHEYRLVWQPPDEHDAMVTGIADLVRRIGETLRECRGQACGRLFIGKKRGEFCSRECQQREMNRRKAVARKDARRRAKEGQ